MDTLKKENGFVSHQKYLLLNETTFFLVPATKNIYDVALKIHFF